MYQALVAFREAHGHCRVSRKCSVPGLGTWAAAQRQAKQSGTLSQERTDRLDKLGFVWNLREDR